MNATAPLQTLIDQLATEVHDNERLYEAARQDHDQQRMETCRQQSIGLKIALGHALTVHETGAATESAALAIWRANDHLFKTPASPA